MDVRPERPPKLRARGPFGAGLIALALWPAPFAAAGPPGEPARPDDGQDGQEATVDTANAGGFRLDGEILVGYRIVNQGGRTAKFREDIDLEEGGRLLHGVLTLLPAGDQPARWFDRIQITGSGLGGDPYQSWGVELRKAESYRLRARGRRVDYFQALTGELHSWDTRRNQTDVDLTVTPLTRLELWGKFRRWEQSGSRVTSRDISREEFLFDEPLDQDATTWAVGARYRFETATVWIEQSIRDFQDNGGFGARGLDSGLSPDEAFLTFLEQREVRSASTPVTRAGGTARLADNRVRVTGDVLLSSQELDFSFNRIWEGADFQERPFAETIAATGRVEREVRHANAELLWRAGERLSVTANYRRRGWDQDGSNFVRTVGEFLATGETSESNREGVSTYQVTLDQITVGGEVAASRGVALFAEVGITARSQEVVTDGIAHDSETDTTAFRFGARLRPSRAFDMTASFARADIDDPFARVAPTESNALEVRARLRPSEGWQLATNVTVRDRSNEVSRVDLRTVAWGGTVTYRRAPEQWVMVGYTRLDYDASVPIVYRPFFAGRREASADSSIASNVITLAAEYRADGSPLTVFGRASYVTNEGALPLVGFQPPLRDRAGNRHEIELGDWTLGLRYFFDHGLYGELAGRFVDHEQNTVLVSEVDDYDASILTLGFGIRF